MSRTSRRIIMELLMSDDDIYLRDDYATAVAAPLPASVVASGSGARGSLEKVSDASNTGSIASGRFKLSGAAAATYRFATRSDNAINSDTPFAVSFIYNHTSGNFEIGLYSDSTASGNPTAGLYPINNKLQLKIGADVIEAFALTAATDYRVTIEYDGTLTKWLIKGGTEYAAWTEIYRTRLIAWGANSYFLVKNTSAVVEFDETRAQNRYVFDTTPTIYPTFRVETAGADTYDPLITTSSGTATWQYGDLSADEVTNTVSHAIAGAQKMLVRITNISPANILSAALNGDKIAGDIHAIIQNGGMTSLTTITLYDNLLSGNIPAEIGNLTSLTQLQMQVNSFSGNIPAEIGNLTSLTSLNLHINALDISSDFMSTLLSIQSFTIQSNALTQSEVDAVIASIYANRASYTYATPALNIGGSNASGTGNYTDPLVTPGSGNSNSDWSWNGSTHDPLTTKAQIFTLVNDHRSEGFSVWTITYTA